jgi:uncharacterized protein YjbI with pentapeptide repeats
MVMAEPNPGDGAQAAALSPLAPRSLVELQAALAAGQRRFVGLNLGDLDGGDLDLSGCDLREGCFQEARFGHARLTNAVVEGCGFQQSLLWGADLSGLRARASF